ncbi:MAG: CsgG/HfaB family protein [candidate division KSB1 bacterium]|nr:CsgG/HfaB family protein [candidate division KSB1 bacterium]MDZ7357858.1 CsgG/HfaB family protein [candidate division KSB1 bacterium]MDZ7400410.1 CsgG/HfaB family protein [candidate division KSB1 bacterium]
MINKCKILIWLVFLISRGIPNLFAQQAQDSTKIIVAVMDFKNNSSVFGYDRFERTITELLKTELSRSTDLLVVERSKLEAILREQALAQAGILATQEAQQVGRLAGADFIISGEINAIGSQFRIDAHLIKAGTGQISGEKVTSRSADNIEQMIRLLAQNIIFNLTGKGERLQSAKLRNYRSHWAALGTIALAAATAIFHFNYQNKYDRYLQTDLFGDFDRYYSDANRSYRARNISLSATIAGTLATIALWKRDRSDNNYIYASSDSKAFPIKATFEDQEQGKFSVSFTLQF